MITITPKKIDTRARRRSVTALAKGLGLEGDIFVSVVSDAELRLVNWKVFGSRALTDVITLNYDEDGICGEVLISDGATIRQSRERGIRASDELLRLMTHGLAHLSGHDDTSGPALRKMRRVEFELLMRDY